MKYLSIYIGILLFFISCYDDLGNYKTKQINDMEIELKDFYEVILPHDGFDTLLIVPEVKQKMREDNGNLKYRWRKRDDSQLYNVFSESKDLQIITAANEHTDLYLRFEVEDTVLNIISCKDVQIKKKKPFQNGWFVLQNKNNTAVLGCIDGRGEKGQVTLDVNDLIVGGIGAINGVPRFLSANTFYARTDGFNDEVIPRIDIVTDEMGYRYEVANMEKVFEYPDLLINKRKNGDFNYNIQFAQFFGLEMIIENGVFWFAYGNGDGHSVYYPAKLEGVDSMDYQATYAYSSNPTHQYAVVYDNKYHRFLWYPNSAQIIQNNFYTNEAIRMGQEKYYTINGKANKTRLRPVEKNLHDVEDSFDPQDIGNQEIVYMGGIDNNKFVACGARNNDRSLTIYEMSFNGLNKGTEAVCSGKFTYQLPDDVERCFFASSVYYTNSMFYASGNKLYRLELQNGVAKETLIYEYSEDAGATFAGLKFEHETQTNYAPIYDDKGKIEDWDDERLTARLGGILNLSNGQDAVLSISLNDNGNVDGSWVYAKDSKGIPFDKIVDIAYISQPKQ